jgi:spore germination cell wall hydrolase CwlJ-like protein
MHDRAFVIVALRSFMPVQRRKRVASLGLAALAFSILPNQVGYQDLGALLARRPAVTRHWQNYLLGRPPSAMPSSVFEMRRPIGTAIPRPPLYVLASVDPNALAGALGRELLGNSTTVQFPSVNRGGKGDSLAHRPRAPMPPVALTLAAPQVEPVSPKLLADRLPSAGETTGAIGTSGVEARVFFGADPVGAADERIAPWREGEAPRIVAASGDTDLKLAALTPPAAGDLLGTKGGESIAAKGEVTGPERRPMSPAQRLKLDGRDRAVAEKCLAEAVYFESRDEPVSAQIAVAQVVLNRVFSPFYPKTVCGVVYQNAYRHLKCQFTFACDGKRDTVTEPDAWDRARKIAADMLDGKLWMPGVAKSTHYHDDWAHPDWVGEMRRIDKLGGLIFYRPRNWGDGSDEPKWGDPKTTAKTEAKL